MSGRHGTRGLNRVGRREVVDDGTGVAGHGGWVVVDLVEKQVQGRVRRGVPGPCNKMITRLLSKTSRAATATRCHRCPVAVNGLEGELTD